MRRALLALAFSSLLITGCGAPETRARFERAPVFIVSIDTLRSDHLAAYGYRGAATPRIDAFRREGILFEHAYSPSPMTLPSHVSMLTGRLPFEHGVRDNIGFRYEGRGSASLPEVLRRSGYATGAAVSAYVLRGDTGLGALFDYFEDAIPPK
ncbi:MAG TPA: sulfatase-like hydrolase/transferase, partial [Thermoanaerobaculia bacterium]